MSPLPINYYLISITFDFSRLELFFYVGRF